MASLADARLDETPFLVIDVETTGLDPEEERIVEICAARVRVGERPEIVLDTLVDPGRAVTAGAIHGIRDEDVAGAPRLADLAETLRSLCAGHVVAGHNVRFDLRFLDAGLARVGRRLRPPFVCTMRLPAVLGRPPDWPLWWACHRAGVVFEEHPHSARGDAKATAALFAHQLAALRAAGLDTFGALAERAAAWPFSFVRSLRRSVGEFAPLIAPPPLRPRAPGDLGIGVVDPARRYLDAVVRALVGLEITPARRAAVAAARARLGVDAETAAAVHARVIARAERRRDDMEPTDDDLAHLAALRRCIAAL